MMGKHDSYENLGSEMGLCFTCTAGVYNKSTRGWASAAARSEAIRLFNWLGGRHDQIGH